MLIIFESRKFQYERLSTHLHILVSSDFIFDEFNLENMGRFFKNLNYKMIYVGIAKIMSIEDPYLWAIFWEKFDDLVN